MKDGDDHVLSSELRENFDTMRDLIKQEKKRKDAPSDESFQAKKVQVALKTALAVEEEVLRLRNGIAELEAMLAREEGGEDVTFPALPPVVPSEIQVVEPPVEESCPSKKVAGKMVHG